VLYASTTTHYLRFPRTPLFGVVRQAARIPRFLSTLFPFSFDRYSPRIPFACFRQASLAHFMLYCIIRFPFSFDSCNPRIPCYYLAQLLLTAALIVFTKLKHTNGLYFYYSNIVIIIRLDLILAEESKRTLGFGGRLWRRGRAKGVKTSSTHFRRNVRYSASILLICPLVNRPNSSKQFPGKYCVIRSKKRNNLRPHTCRRQLKWIPIQITTHVHIIVDRIESGI